jgi:hypothetical protein
LAENKIYIDTCVLSSIRNLDWKDTDRDALDLISDLEGVMMMTSQKTLDEFKNSKDKNLMVALKLIYKIISKTPTRPSMSYGGWGSGSWGAVPFGGGSTQDPKLTKLRSIFKQVDASHIYEASESGCNYFLTTDRKTILNKYKSRKTEIDAFVGGLRIVDPVELLKLIKQ